MQSDINIFYSINDENEKNSGFSLDELKTYINYDNIVTDDTLCDSDCDCDDIDVSIGVDIDTDLDNHLDDMYAMYYDYNNYTIKSLNHIMDFYKLKHKRLKEDIIQDLIAFEGDVQNKDIVNERIRLWKNIKELSDHPYFKKYIIFDI